MSELNKFLTWLKEKYPELYDKYRTNFTPQNFLETPSDGFLVDESNKISRDEYEMLFRVAQEYHKTLE